MGLPRREMSVPWILVFVTPPEVRRSFMFPCLYVVRAAAIDRYAR
jgi:hypothetical protein